ncbi:YfjI family protein [Micromonospora globbae]|uniref:YfjI family protein n=1 Tax=Micromonospora globbae TaxID=1894969 RepID=UPI003429760A
MTTTYSDCPVCGVGLDPDGSCWNCATASHDAVQVNDSVHLAGVAAATPAEIRAAPIPDWPTPEPIAKTAKTRLPASDRREPARLWRMVDAVAEAYQVPRALAFLLVLAILAASVGGRRRVRVAPDWTEVLALYTAAAVPSGERKSPVLAALSAPLLAVERELAEKMAPEVASQRALRDLRAAAVEKIKRKGDTSPAAIAELEDAVRDLETTVVPAIPRLLADDSTPEAMARLMAEQGGRLGVLSAEGGLFSTLAGRYSSGIPNLDLVLKAWSGDFCRVDRISRDTITLTEPVLSIGLAVQPDILATLAEGKNFRGSGLLARFLYAIPDSLVGSRTVDPEPVPEQVAAEYAEAVATLARTVHTGADTVEMKLTEPARAVLNSFRQDLEPRLHPDYGDLANIADWSNKLPGQLVRIAALFTLFSDPTGVEVGERAMREAVSLAPYLISHAVAAFELMSGRRSPLEPARAVLRWIGRKRLTSFTVRQAWRDLSGQTWATDTDAIREALADLVDLGWLRLAAQPEQRGPGRPSERYEVHPLATKEKP